VKSPLKQKIGQRIHDLREASGLSQVALSDLLDIDQESMSRYESGGSLPRIERLQRMAELLGVELRDFFTFPAETKPKAPSPDAQKLLEYVRVTSAADPSFARKALKLLRLYVSR
jgi:transcriptional regulator with XRE-family HTH domain